jgi:hypothetical protein
MEMTGSDHALLGALMAMSVGLVKIIERVVDWAVAKKKKKLEDDEDAERQNSNGHRPFVIVQLDPEASRMIMNTNNKINQVSDIIAKIDSNGIPMVYTPRAMVGAQEKLADEMKDLTNGQQLILREIDRSLEEQRHDHQRSHEEHLQNGEKLEVVLSMIKK